MIGKFQQFTDTAAFWKLVSGLTLYADMVTIQSNKRTMRTRNIYMYIRLMYDYTISGVSLKTLSETSQVGGGKNG